MIDPAASAGGGLAVRESGLLVPAHLANHNPEEPAAATGSDGTDRQGGLDPDGRRRLVLAREVRKRFTRLAGELDRDDVGFVLWCKTHRQTTKTVKDAKTGEDVAVNMREEIAGACGNVMLREGEGTPDPGFGCKCTRVHFAAGF